jgi:SNF family Na+-dependent transporter
VYVIIPLPYIILFVFLIKGLTLEGCEIGWKYLFTAQWDRLLTLQIWRDAAGQVLFSSGIGINLTIHFASLNKK